MLKAAKRSRYKDAAEIAKGNCSPLAILKAIESGLTECTFRDKKDFTKDDAMCLMVYHLQKHFKHISDRSYPDLAHSIESVTLRVEKKNDLLAKKEQAKERGQRNRRDRRG